MSNYPAHALENEDRHSARITCSPSPPLLCTKSVPAAAGLTSSFTTLRSCPTISVAAPATSRSPTYLVSTTYCGAQNIITCVSRGASAWPPRYILHRYESLPGCTVHMCILYALLFFTCEHRNSVHTTGMHQRMPESAPASARGGARACSASSRSAARGPVSSILLKLSLKVHS